MKTPISTIIRIELTKLGKRKDWLALLALVAISILFGSSILTDGYTGAKNQSALFWVCTQIFNASILFITPMVVAFTSSRILASEIENGSIILYINKFRNRRRMYLAKSISLTCYITVVFIAVGLTNLAIYYLFSMGNPLFTTGRFFGENTVLLLLSLLTLYLSSFLIVTQFALLLGTYLKSVPLIGTTFLVTLIAHYTYKVPFFSLINPWCYVVRIVGDSSSTTERISADYGVMLSLTFGLVLLSIILTILFNVLGARRFQRMDL